MGSESTACFEHLRQLWKQRVQNGKTVAIVPASAPWLVRTFRSKSPEQGWTETSESGEGKCTTAHVLEEIETAIGFVDDRYA